MRQIYFDCVGGAAGDMLLASLIDAGASEEAVRGAIAALPLDGVGLHVRRDRLGPFAVTRIEVEAGDEQPRRHLEDVLALVRAGGFTPLVEEQIARVFRRLAVAEARVHGTSVDEVHFHEVGAVDSIVDIVGTVVALDSLEVETVLFSTLAPGRGVIDSEHGPIPVPAPATLELLQGVPIRLGGEPGEWVTPTGAALLTELGRPGGAPIMTVERIGIGAGTRVRRDVPNIVRAVVGEVTAPVHGGTAHTGPAHTGPAPGPGSEADDAQAWQVLRDEIVVLEATIDDTTPEAMAHAAELVRERGALDVTMTPVLMKKGRSGVTLTVLARPEAEDELTAMVLRETSTLGVRARREWRRVLPRRIVTVTTSYGDVRVKETRRPQAGAGDPLSVNGELDAAPEAADVAELARSRAVPFRTVYQAALEAYRRDWS